MNIILTGVLYGLLAGALCGLVPLGLCVPRNRLHFGILAFFACTMAGGLLGLLAAAPLSAYFSWKLLHPVKL